MLTAIALLALSALSGPEDVSFDSLFENPPLATRGPLTDPEPVTPARQLERGRWHAGLRLGIAHPTGIGARSTEPNSIGDLRVVRVAPHAGVGISDVFGEDRWFRGSFSLEFEASLMRKFEPHTGLAVGADVLLRYHFLGEERTWVPFLEGGVGVHWIDFDLQRQADGISFTPQLGLGVLWFVEDDLAITASWRFHHLSNAGLGNPNPGVNTSQWGIGLTVFF